jgi:hypothetical protein
MSYRRRNSIGGQFAPRLIEMLRSPAYRAMSRAGHQVLARVEIELADHGGMDNGNLPVTFDQFVDYGMHRHAIAPGIREVTALGFIEITEQGRAGNGAWRRPTKFRITYRNADRAPPTHEWRRITEDEATMIAKGARREGSNSAVRRSPNHSKSNGQKNRTPVTENATPSDGKRTTNSDSPVTETITTVPVTETITTIDTLGVGVGDAAVSVRQAPAPQPAPWWDAVGGKRRLRLVTVLRSTTAMVLTLRTGAPPLKNQ